MDLTKEKLRLMVIFPAIGRGGAEEYALTIALAAVKEGYDVHVAFPKRETTASLVQSFEEKGVTYHPLEIPETNLLKFKAIKKYLPYFIRTVLLLIRKKPDLVQIVIPYTDLCLGSLLACGFLRIRTVVVFQLSPSLIYFNSIRLKLYAWARNRNQQWIAVSEHNRRIIAESFQTPLDEILRIYNGAKIGSVAHNFNQEEITAARTHLRQELNLPETSRIALTVGRLAPQKGYTDLISAIPDIVKEFPGVRFVWVGDGPQREELVNSLREHGIEDKVFLLGYRSDVPTILSAADVFIFPTHFEGQPFALLEAMAYSLPIVTSDACGIPELIENRVHGLLFPTKDRCELLKSIYWALQHPQEMQEMAMNAKSRVLEFSEEKMVETTLSVLHKLSP